MPYMVLNRNHVLRSLKGHSAAFVKDQPAWVHPHIAVEAVAIGAEMAPDEKTPKPEVLPADKPMPNAGPIDAAAREKQLIEAINMLIAQNVRDSFTAGGQPTPVAMKELLGYATDRKEINTAFLKRAEMIVAGMLGPNGEYA